MPSALDNLLISGAQGQESAAGLAILRSPRAYWRYLDPRIPPASLADSRQVPLGIGLPIKLNRAVWGATLQPSFSYRDTELNRLFVRRS
jgi:hypothetical protein